MYDQSLNRGHPLGRCLVLFSGADPLAVQNSSFMYTVSFTYEYSSYIEIGWLSLIPRQFMIGTTKTNRFGPWTIPLCSPILSTLSLILQYSLILKW